MAIGSDSAAPLVELADFRALTWSGDPAGLAEHYAPVVGAAVGSRLDYAETLPPLPAGCAAAAATPCGAAS